MNSVLDKVRETVTANALIRRGDSVLIGLSGGADSVCLTHILSRLAAELDLTPYAAHINHGIRGAEAERDAEFAKTFCENLGIECTVKTADVPAYAAERGISEELAGREIRYTFFDEICKTRGIDKIATAHNRSDNAETITMNFMRGAALAGLCGIPYRRSNIIRPLLDATRSEIEEYCRENGLKYVTDSTNFEDIYTRNRVRHNMIPLIEREFNPNFANTVTRNAQIIRADEDFLTEYADSAYNNTVIENGADISALLNYHEAIGRRIVRKMMSAVTDLSDGSADYADDILTIAKRGKTGMSLNLPKGIAARIEYGRLIIEKPKTAADYEYKLKIGSEIYIPEAEMTIRAEAADSRTDDGAQYFSGENVFDITIRNRRAGDKFYPAGMTGSKKLKDYFIDEKIPRDERNTVPIITFGGEIGCIVGKRRDGRFKFTGSGVKIFITKS